MTTQNKLKLVLLLTGLISGCQDDDPVRSPIVGNADVRAEMSAIADGTGSIVLQVELLEESTGRSLKLEEDEKLIASQNSDPGRLFNLEGDLWERSERNAQSIIWLRDKPAEPGYAYTGIFYQEQLQDTFYVTFERTADQSIENSQVSMPAPFQITYPLGNQQIARTEGPLNLQWTPSGNNENLELQVDGNCISSSGETTRQIEDTGEISLELTGVNNTSCVVTIVLKRIKPGVVSAKFGKGGFIHGIQQRTVSFISVP